MIRATVAKPGVRLAPSRYAFKNILPETIEQTDNLLSRLSTRPPRPAVVAIDAWFRDGVAAGWLSKIHIAYGLAVDKDTSDALVSWIDDGPSLSISGTGTITPRSGFAGNGSNGYLTPGLSYGTLASSTNIGVDCWSLTDLASSTMRDFGAVTGSELVAIGRTASDAMSIRVAEGSSHTITGVPNSIGMIGVQRSGTTVTGLRDGAFLQSFTSTATSLPTGDISLGRSTTVYSTRTYGWFCVREAFTEAEYLSYYDATRRYMIAVQAVSDVEYFTEDFEGSDRLYVRRSDTTMRRGHTMRYIACTGNSTSVGSQDSDGPQISISDPPSPYSGIMFRDDWGNGAGTRGHGSSSLNPSDLSDFIPAYEQEGIGQLGETGLSSMMRMLSYLNDRDVKSNIFVARTHGAAGFDTSEIQSGSQPYANGLTELKRAISLGKIYNNGNGRRYSFRAQDVICANGHQDRTAIEDLLLDRATLTASYESLLSSYTTDWNALTGETNFRLWISQLDARMVSTAVTGSDATLAQNDFVRDNPAARMVCPRYLFWHLDSLHFYPDRGYDWEGEYWAKGLWHEWKYDAGDEDYPWAALGTHITVNRSWDTVTIRFFHDAAHSYPWGGLLFNTTSLPLASNYGFKWHDDSASATVSSVAITTTTVANDTVTITLSGIPSGSNKYISYAFDGPGSNPRTATPGAGAWGNLTDSDDLGSICFPSETLPNWCIIFKEPAT